ncbi:hypothetical protein [Halosolutus gelatinilyticus]|uniref:hypothetical protein n=1 Tax=Halosolutus gelatinilyticus TaxID=2931975 RepID=UPI001FF692B7|nr:hypothetical protein [Halosolutus gelatinilyticus]
MSRGLLTKSEREFLRGEKDDVDARQYRYNIRSNFRSRVSELEDDLELLRDAGEEELVEEFHNTFSRMDRLEREVERLRDELDQERDS